MGVVDPPSIHSASTLTSSIAFSSPVELILIVGINNDASEPSSER
ncbi:MULTISPECIES: hypothetical protein [unclassified Mesorhizobium]|nr:MULTISPECIES: hypothetical protein [unclassified Mesorhizobium]ESX82647.1 hypothetical protein X756_30985 [Mesorhizobium sp. LSHC412B00]